MQCKTNIFVDISEKLPGPLYVYYELDNFYQNHRKYVKSRSYHQLLGNYLEKASDLLDCDPVSQVKDLWPHQRISFSGKQMDPEDQAIPCGLIAKSIFNDDFTLI